VPRQLEFRRNANIINSLQKSGVQVGPNIAVAREETSGPVAPRFRFKTEEEVIEMVNATEFGLASYF
jgi:acyl-CoA reductase-like NAD-dependent aldehyde dehydrogenase